MRILEFLVQYRVLFSTGGALLAAGVGGGLLGLRRRVCRRLIVAADVVLIAHCFLGMGILGPSRTWIVVTGFWIFVLILDVRALRNDDDDDDDRPPRRRKARQRWVPDLSRLTLPAVLPSPA